MFKFRIVLNAPLVLLLSLTFNVLVNAQAIAPQRTFVSAQRGDDANASNGNICNVTNPCRSFNAAIGVVRTNGEVIALDSGGYGPVTINKAVTLTGPSGVYVAITAQTTDAITVSAGPSDSVFIKGLTLKSLGASSANGINFISGSMLHVEGCTISGFFNPNGPSAAIYDQNSLAYSQLFVKDTTMLDNVNGIYFASSGELYASDVTFRYDNYGIYIYPTVAGTGKVLIARAELENSGLSVFNGAKVVVRDSFQAGAGAGYMVYGSGSEMTLENCTAMNDQHGVYALNAGLARISNSTITNNVTGLENLVTGPGTIESRGNNTVRSNTNNTIGAITPFSPM